MLTFTFYQQKCDEKFQSFAESCQEKGWEECVGREMQIEKWWQSAKEPKMVGNYSA